MRKQRITYTSPLDALIAVSKRLSLYENQQRMDSEALIDRYHKGLLPDETIFVEWSNDYQHYLALRQQLEGLLVTPTSPKLNTLLERLHTVEKINAAPGLSENHSVYLESHSEKLAEKFIREDVQWGLHGKH